MTLLSSIFSMEFDIIKNGFISKCTLLIVLTLNFSIISLMFSHVQNANYEVGPCCKSFSDFTLMLTTNLFFLPLFPCVSKPLPYLKHNQIVTKYFTVYIQIHSKKGKSPGTRDEKQTLLQSIQQLLNSNSADRYQNHS